LLSFTLSFSFSFSFSFTSCLGGVLSLSSISCRRVVAPLRLVCLSQRLCPCGLCRCLCHHGHTVTPITVLVPSRSHSHSVLYSVCEGACANAVTQSLCSHVHFSVCTCACAIVRPHGHTATRTLWTVSVRVLVPTRSHTGAYLVSNCLSGISRASGGRYCRSIATGSPSCGYFREPEGHALSQAQAQSRHPGHGHRDTPPARTRAHSGHPQPCSTTACGPAAAGSHNMVI
jgi:hypothetical protein